MTGIAEQARAQADATGTRYVVARQEVLLEAGPQPWGGIQPDVAATANALRRAGVLGPTGAPIDEVDVLGLGGGLGFMVAVFVYEGFGPTMTITTRTSSTPDPFVASALARVGAEVDVVTTGSAAVARRRLDEALAAGQQPVLSVETGAVPYHRTDGAWLGAGPRLIGVLAQDGERYTVDDRAVGSLHLDADQLAAARSVGAKAKHRALMVTGPAAGHDPVAATLAALRRTVDGYSESPAKSFVNNIGTNGLRTWATRLTATNAKGWGRVFSEPAQLHDGLRRVAECIDHELTAPGAGRPLFAVWLERAQRVTGLDGLSEVAAAIVDAGQRWQSLSELAAQADPSVARAVDAVDRIHEQLDAHGDDTRDAVLALRAEVAHARQTATLAGADAGELFAEMAAEASVIADIERTALDTLAALLPG